MAVFLDNIRPADATLLCGIAGVVSTSVFYCMNTTINYVAFPAVFLGQPPHQGSKATSHSFVPAMDVPASSVSHLNRQWQEMYFRGHRVGPALAIIGGTVFSTASYLAQQSFVKQVFAAATVSSFAVIPYTLIFIVSTNNELHRRSFITTKDPLASNHIDESETVTLLSKWLALSKTRANISLLSACLGVIGVIALS